MSTKEVALGPHYAQKLHLKFAEVSGELQSM
jgi:hypothetical protein